MNTKTKVSHKNSDLTSILVSHFGKSINLARIKFIGLFICALCKVQVVCFEKLASGFRAMARTGSGEDLPPRIQILDRIHLFPQRVKCAVLPWETLVSAIEHKQE